MLKQGNNTKISRLIQGQKTQPARKKIRDAGVPARHGISHRIGHGRPGFTISLPYHVRTHMPGTDCALHDSLDRAQDNRLTWTKYFSLRPRSGQGSNTPPAKQRHARHEKQAVPGVLGAIREVVVGMKAWHMAVAQSARVRGLHQRFVSFLDEDKLESSR